MINKNQFNGNSEVLRPTISPRYLCNFFLIQLRITVSKLDTFVQDLMY